MVTQVGRSNLAPCASRSLCHLPMGLLSWGPFPAVASSLLGVPVFRGDPCGREEQTLPNCSELLHAKVAGAAGPVLGRVSRLHVACWHLRLSRRSGTFCVIISLMVFLKSTQFLQT